MTIFCIHRYIKARCILMSPKPGPNSTISIYKASALKIYIGTNSMARF
jgi:hypothetical protein